VQRLSTETANWPKGDCALNNVYGKLAKQVFKSKVTSVSSALRIPTATELSPPLPGREKLCDYVIDIATFDRTVS
jgi:hypothetical protein